jgi:hypothetical protein
MTDNEVQYPSRVDNNVYLVETMGRLMNVNWTEIATEIGGMQELEGYAFHDFASRGEEDDIISIVFRRWDKRTRSRIFLNVTFWRPAYDVQRPAND